MHPSDQHSSPAIQQAHLTYFDTLPYTQSTPSPSTFTFNRPLGYFDAQSIIDSSSSSQGQGSIPYQYMTGYYASENPAIRIQQSSPAPGMQLPQSYTDSSAQQFNRNSNWDNGQQMAVRPLQAAAFQRNRSHQRAQSSSSMGSNTSASPYPQSHAAYGYNVNDTSVPTKIGQNYASHGQSSNSFSNHLPTPIQTPTQDSFLSAGYPNSYSQSGDMNGVVAAHLAMNHSIENADEDLPGMSNSGRQSVSSMGQDPSTPRTIPENFDVGFKVPANDHQMRFPKLDRTVSDAYNDALFTGANNAQPPTSSIPKSIQTQHLSPHRNQIHEYLQRAQMARSQSPTSSGSRGVSPFRPSSPYIQTAFGQMQRPFTATSVRQAQQAHASQMEMSQHVGKPQAETPKTISPKDAVLEYNESEEDAKMPLFTEDEASGFGQQFEGGQQQNFSAGVQNVGRADTWTNDAPQHRNATAPQNSASFNFATPSVTGYPNNLTFPSQNYHRRSSMKQEETPEFPAHLTSMDSSASEAPISSQNSNHYIESSAKPAPSAADSGTYTCTYHGCNLRFESPQKLQKHKRDGHRNPAIGATSPTPGVGSGMTSAELAARNSQSGPHKCERINPTTGKPCNTIFSRPYDLTRHEDTIHNIRKQKVRCALCVEDKTFSRNDALTRHMRVVHPEVDFPGKHRRRGEH
jgi:hypothetical protein